MLIHLVPLSCYVVHVDDVLGVNDRLPADRASVVVINPAQKAVDMEDVVRAARQGYDVITFFKIDQADRTLGTESRRRRLLLLLSEKDSLTLMGLRDLFPSCLQHINCLSKALWVDTHFN